MPTTDWPTIAEATRKTTVIRTECQKTVSWYSRRMFVVPVNENDCAWSPTSSRLVKPR